MQGREGSARALWVTDEPPDRELGGGNIRQSHLFGALAVTIPTDLLITGQVTNPETSELAADVIELPARSMPRSEHPVGRRAVELALVVGSRYPLSVYPTLANRLALARAIRERAHAYDLVCVSHQALAPLLPKVRSAKWILSLHHLLSGMIAEELRLAPGARQRWFRARELTKAQQLERWALEAYDRCIVCSKLDADRMRTLAGKDTASLAVIPNGVDLSALRATPVPRAQRVLLPGTLAWPPNIDGAVWFCTEVWPRVREQMPDATLVLAGRSPVAAVNELGQLPGVSVECDVPSMAPYFESARVVVVPLRIGTGTRIKALEAMAAARPVVGTTIGLEGIEIEDRVHARVADDGAAFASAVVELLRDDATADALGRVARAHVEQHFAWQRAGEQFVELTLACLGRDASSQAELRSSSKLA